MLTSPNTASCCSGSIFLPYAYLCNFNMAVFSFIFLFFTGLSDKDIKAQLIDYGIDYPEGNPVSLKEVTYAELKSGYVEFRGRNIPSSPLSSYPKARKIANVLKEWIENGFTVGVPQIQAPTIPYVKNR